MFRVDSKRKGFFVISDQSFSMTELEALFDGFVPVQAHVDLMAGETEFYGYSRHFREIDLGQVAPEYFPTITRLDDGAVKVTWRCELDPEPTPGISEPDYDRIRRAVEIVIKRHELEWKEQSEAWVARYKMQFGDMVRCWDRFFEREFQRRMLHPGLGFVSFPGDNQLMRAGSMAGSFGGLLGSNV